MDMTTFEGRTMSVSVPPADLPQLEARAARRRIDARQLALSMAGDRLKYEDELFNLKAVRYADYDSPANGQAALAREARAEIVEAERQISALRKKIDESTKAMDRADAEARRLRKEGEAVYGGRQRILEHTLARTEHWTIV